MNAIGFLTTMERRNKGADGNGLPVVQKFLLALSSLPPTIFRNRSRDRRL
jgi:hypothetical protein